MLRKFETTVVAVDVHVVVADMGDSTTFDLTSGHLGLGHLGLLGHGDLGLGDLGLLELDDDRVRLLVASDEPSSTGLFATSPSSLLSCCAAAAGECNGVSSESSFNSRRRC